MKRTITYKEYRAYIYDTKRACFVPCGIGVFRTLEDCKSFFEEKKKNDGCYMYKDCDWDNVRYGCKEYTVTDWGFINE